MVTEETAEQQRRFAQSLLDLTNQYPGRERCFPRGEVRTDRDAAGKLCTGAKLLD
jgi:hypothetical protein